MDTSERITTREAAERLGLRHRQNDALVLLRVAGIGRTRCGSSYLWDAAGVEVLRANLHIDQEGSPLSAAETLGRPDGANESERRSP